MKKWITLLAVIGLTSATASAQLIRLGVKGGISSLSTDINGIYPMDDMLLQANLESRSVGWHVGLMGRISIPLTGIYVQPELMFNHAGYKYRNEFGHSANVKFNNIELPVLVGFKVLFLNFHAGPVFNLGTFESNKDDFKIKRPNFGFQFGTGFTYHQLTFDVRYHAYFQSNKKNLVFNDVYNKIKANEGFWSFSFGYFF